MTTGPDAPSALPSYDEPFHPERSPFLWLLEREVLRFLTIWRYSVVGPVLSTVLFVVVFGSALGRHVDTIDGVSYGRFIVPGLFAQAIVNVGFVNGTTSLFEARRDRYIHDVFASPLRWWERGTGERWCRPRRRRRWGSAGGGSPAHRRRERRPPPRPAVRHARCAPGRRTGGRDRGQPRQVARPRLLHGVNRSAAAGLPRRRLLLGPAAAPGLGRSEPPRPGLLAGPGRADRLPRPGRRRRGMGPSRSLPRPDSSSAAGARCRTRFTWVPASWA